VRPFGSLLVQLARVAVGEGSASFSVFHTLGEIEDAMSVFNRIRPPTGQLPDLLALALDRPMRNYAAHEDIVRSATGELAVIDASGSMMLVDLNLLREHLLMLGSFLAGVDVAISVVFTAVSLHLPYPTDTLKTEAFVGALAGIAIAEWTDAVLIDSRIRDGAITLQIEGSASNNDVRLAVRSLRRILDPALSVMRVERPSGTLVYSESLEN
jgi:hypothetical protein